MLARRRAIRCGAAVTVVAIGALLGACGTTSSRQISGGPAPSRAQAAGALHALRAQSARLIDGGPSAFRRRVASLRGFPVVVNQWASWCGPCRYEFPFFQRLARTYTGRVGFLGVDSQDGRSYAKGFLRRFPVPYPSFYDRDASIARVFEGGRAWPTTAFYSRSARLVYVHPGAYASQAKLDADIRRYAVHG
jgi:cytochrome c biogenesis protein CcmG/thiol:disulfide interchange protein DsbE